MKKYSSCPKCGAVHTISLYHHAKRKCYFCRKPFQLGKLYSTVYEAYRSYLSLNSLSILRTELGKLTLTD